MKLFLLQPSRSRRPEGLGRPVQGFTLPEILIAMALFIILLAGLVSASLFGLRMYQASDIKANASDGARLGLNKMLEDIRGARVSRVGTYAGGTFTDTPDGVRQEGNALMLHYTTDTNLYILYYRDSVDEVLKRLNSVSGIREKLAHSVTNQVVFRGEDYHGTVITNSQNNRAVHISMEFSQTQYPKAAIGPGNLIDYYKLETCVTPRVVE